jgi:hypothetical protein
MYPQYQDLSAPRLNLFGLFICIKSLHPSRQIWQTRVDVFLAACPMACQIPSLGWSNAISRQACLLLSGLQGADDVIGRPAYG